MELRQLKTFQTVARLLSFNRAAEVLNYSQSAVSTQIRLLEDEFGVSLFHRLGKRISLTEAGRTLIQYSQKMLDIENETRARVAEREDPQGSLSIRIPQSIGTYFLPQILREFQFRFPRVGMDISTCAYEALIHELKTGITDLAFLFAESVPFAELKTELLRVEQLVLVSAPDHLLAGRSSVDLRELTGQTILLPKHDCSYKMVFEQALTEAKIGDTTFMEINSVETIKQCVLSGIGVAVIPAMAVRKEIAQKRLAVLSWPEEALETGILMICHRDKWISPTMKAFMNTARGVLKSSMAG